MLNWEEAVPFSLRVLVRTQWGRKFKIVQAKKNLVKSNKSISRKIFFDQNPIFAISKMGKKLFLNWEKV